MFSLEFFLKYVDIFFLFLLVVFLFFTFKGVLGKSVGRSREDVKEKEEIKEKNRTFADKSSLNTENNQQMESSTDISAEYTVNEYPVGSLAYNIDLIKRKDHSFQENSFIDFTQKTFKLVVIGFAEGKLEKIKALVSDKIYTYYHNAVEARNSNGSKLFVEIQDFLITDIYDINIGANNIASIRVKFVTMQLREENISEHLSTHVNKNKLKNFSEYWTFSKNLEDSTSAWKIIKIASI